MRLVPSCSHHHKSVLVGMTTSYYAISGKGNGAATKYDAGEHPPRNLSRHVLVSII